MEGLNAILSSLTQMMYIVETNVYELHKLDEKYSWLCQRKMIMSKYTRKA